MCKPLEKCKTHDDFTGRAVHEGAQVRHGGCHDVVVTPKGIAALPRHKGEYHPGLLHAIRKQFKLIGLAVLMFALLAKVVTG